MDARAARIAEAKRAGLLARLRDALRSADRAEALLASYEAQAAAAGLSPLSETYWAEVEPWLARHAVVRRQGDG